MKLEDQFCSIELAERLKSLGVDQSSLFYWWQPENVMTKHHILIYERDITDNEWKANKHIAAFTAAELGEMIPPIHYNFYKNQVGYVFSISGAPNVYDKNLANCMAKMLIYLIENKIMELPK